MFALLQVWCRCVGQEVDRGDSEQCKSQTSSWSGPSYTGTSTYSKSEVNEVLQTKQGVCMREYLCVCASRFWLPCLCLWSSLLESRLCAFPVLHPVLFPNCIFPLQFHLHVVTSCPCFEIFVRRMAVDGCSRMEAEGRSPSSYGQSQAVLGTLGASWWPLGHHLSSRWPQSLAYFLAAGKLEMRWLKKHFSSYKHPLCACQKSLLIIVGWFSPGVVTGCLVKETLNAGSSLRGDGYMRLRMKKPAPQQNSTPIISSTLGDKRSRTRDRRGFQLISNVQSKHYYLLLYMVNIHTTVELTRSTIASGWTGPSHSNECRSSPRRSDICNKSTGSLSIYTNAFKHT